MAKTANCPQCSGPTELTKRKESYEIGLEDYVVNLILFKCMVCEEEYLTPAAEEKYRKDMALIKKKAEEFALKQKVH